MTIKTEKRIVNVALKLWRGGWNAGYTPDCFNDLGWELFDYYNEDSGYVEISDDELSEVIDWWEHECENANEGEDGDGLMGLREDEIDRGDEWVLLTSELK